jgi:hypothetical protein
MIIPGLLGVVHESGSGSYLYLCGEGRPERWVAWARARDHRVPAFAVVVTHLRGDLR